MKKILITGNSGYIGSHLTQILNTYDQYELYGLDLNQPQIKIKNFTVQDIKTPFGWNYANIEFDCVIHLAAEVAVGRSVLNPTIYYLTNTLGTLNLLQNIKMKRFVFASTGSTVGLNSPYSISKKGAEEIVAQYCSENKIPYTTFRFYNVVGSDGVLPTNPDGLMWNLMNARHTGKFTLFGTDYNTPDGTAIRDYTHVNEICNAVIQGIDNSTNTIENLGHGSGTSVKEMVEIFKNVNSCEFEVVDCPRRAGDLESSVLDNPSIFMKKLYSIDQLLKI
jgi:UDP-glucose 4-epimerase